MVGWIPSSYGILDHYGPYFSFRSFNAQCGTLADWVIM